MQKPRNLRIPNYIKEVVPILLSTTSMRRLLFLLAVKFSRTQAETPKETCRLCPNGGEMMFPDRIIPNLGLASNPHPTCEEAAEYAQYASFRVCGLLQAQSAYCGCPGATRPENSCDFCEDGEPPEFGDRITAMEATCDDLNDYVSHLTHEECATERGQAILRHSFLCGCPFSSPTCAICPDGSIDVSNPDYVLPFFNLNSGQLSPTCLEVAEVAAVAGPASINCELVKEQAGFCGCKDVEPEGNCHLCPDGGVPENLNYTTRFGDTCKSLYKYMEFLPEKDCEDSRRTAAIQSNAYYCGCPGVEPSCTLCQDGLDPPEPGRRASAEGKTCGEVNFEIKGHTSIACEHLHDNIAAMGARCGCPGAEFPVCSVQMGTEFCTHELLNGTDANCECFAFCDGEFLQCHDYPGGLLSERKCSGQKVSGCNRALAELNRLAAEEQNKATENEEEEETSNAHAGPLLEAFVLLGAILWM